MHALDRTQASLPMIPGRAATIPHHYERNGKAHADAALDVATGKVLTLCQPRHRHCEFPAAPFTRIKTAEESLAKIRPARAAPTQITP